MLLSFLFKTKKANPTEELPTAVDYVEWLLKHMLQTSRMELTIDTQRALPGSDKSSQTEPPPCLPDTQSVINRLKILSGINPVNQAKGISGAFARPRKNHNIEVSTQFQDSVKNSICVIRLRIRGLNI